jgi:hypothetical protein
VFFLNNCVGLLFIILEQQVEEELEAGSNGNRLDKADAVLQSAAACRTKANCLSLEQKNKGLRVLVLPGAGRRYVCPPNATETKMQPNQSKRKCPLNEKIVSKNMHVSSGTRHLIRKTLRTSQNAIA